MSIKDEMLLLKTVLEKTTEMKLVWKEDAEEDSYSTTLAGKYLIRAFRVVNGTRYVKIFNAQGSELFLYREDQDDEVTDVFRVVEAAKSSALGLDKAVVEILDVLDKL